MARIAYVSAKKESLCLNRLLKLLAKRHRGIGKIAVGKLCRALDNFKRGVFASFKAFLAEDYYLLLLKQKQKQTAQSLRAALRQTSDD